MLPTLAFDADDTLWHNETVASPAEGRFPVLASIRELPALLADW